MLTKHAAITQIGVVVCLALALGVCPSGAQPRAADFTAPGSIDFRTGAPVSEGVQLHAELFSLASLAGQKLPTIIMAHGWGGTAAGFRRDAIDLATAGYLVITFDYRGWGESAARLVLTGPSPITPESGRNQTFTAEVREVREYIDPIEQTADWFNVIDWAAGEPMVDTNRIGIRGSSYSGGHVFYVAAHEPRIKAVVSQVGGFDSSWVVATESEARETHAEATARARGEAYPEPRSVTRGSLVGAPIREKFARYAPVTFADRVTDPAVLFIVAENEDLLDNETNARLAYERMPGKTKRYVEIAGIGHYDVYRDHRDQVVSLAIEWFDEHLKGK
ncbi:MAG: alpha/beta fold hydrolase [Vicinamibacterales bacterium]|nr:alpha/beta fold hydrolase [Vicinamibacterales bacterium]